MVSRAMTRPDLITFNGLTLNDILSLPDDVIDKYVASGAPVVFQAGSAEILGRFWIDANVLFLEIGHIDGGGEGVLPALAVLAARFAKRRQITTLDWRVHALTCQRPNLRLRRLLERRGFRVVDIPGTGLCYQLIREIRSSSQKSIAGT